MRSIGSTFSLIDEPWIVVLDRGGRQQLVSLRQLLADSHRFRAVVGDLPTQAFAILRLSLAVLHRAMDGPTSERRWRDLWRREALPAEPIDGYLDGFRERFDLLHPVTPFYQVADLRTARDEPVGLERLLGDVPNGLPFLSARLGSGLARITAAEAARWLVHCQAFDPSGIKSGAVGDPRVRGGKGYPIGTGWCGALGGVFLEGPSLRDTLLLNLLPESSPHLRCGPEDAPVWERAPLGAAEEDVRDRGPFGPLGLYTWQSRRIRLVGDERAITGALIANGDRLDPADLHRVEPMTAWRRNQTREKELKRTPVRLPARHDPGRALWRGLEALLPATRRPDATRLGPAVTEWLATLRVSGSIPSDARVTLHAVGAVYGTQLAVIDQIVEDTLTMPVQAFHPEAALRTLIVDSAADAEAAVRHLRTLGANLARAAGAHGDAPTHAAAEAAGAAFALLDRRFRAWLATLRPDTDPVTGRRDWQHTVRDALLTSGSALVAQAGPAAWAGRETGGGRSQYLCSSLADLWFRRGLAKALPLTVTATACQEVPA
ncbi:type I-E CRISPR-associated protein Cse1/CasA [Couchioplanes caeruleus]|uniref:Type I-E CRISPR-associated protein Cse1/CasA n=2 Tax=Couchioplanes caeruleus TaxID=56438 RepID=A0A1K0FH43_9ACTN|nr:type I-E CRISPR-associated protein Cse1/CasA [Couchioplanes caeruleus]OJF12141.1 type I-E CRISPR-associated protein Cse1/CasA [Couchioplanes caeruleus subsp. caeruleus]